jgi:glycosyltransferase involved in cell wall biosynthesis
MPPTPLVSVVIPAFNAVGVIEQTLQSVQAQTFENFEVIIVDDGSTDNTAAIVQRFCSMDPRFVLMTQPHSGVSVARNMAIAHAHGEFIAFLDADDVWLPEKLARQIELFRDYPRVNFTFTNFYMWNGERDLSLWYRNDRPLPDGDMGHKIVFSVSRACAASMSTAMVRREIFYTIGLFDPDLMIGEDWDLWLRLAEHGLWVRGTREPLARYRRWSGCISNQKLKTVEANVRVLEKNLHATRRPGLRPLYERSLALMRVQLELACARLLIKTQPNAVPAAIWRAWRLNPRQLKWLMRFVLLIWPRILGGRATERIVHRKLIQKW